MLKKINEQEYVAFNANGREYPVLVYLKDATEIFKFNYVKELIEKEELSAFGVSKWCIHQHVSYALINPYRIKDYFTRPGEVWKFYKTRFQNLSYKHSYEIGKPNTSGF